MNQATRAFTVVELMVSIAIVMIVAVALMPMISGFSGRNDAKHGMNSMIGFLGEIKMRAAFTGLAHQVRFVQTGSGQLIADRASGGSCCCQGAGDPFLAANGGTLGVATHDVRMESPELVVHATDPNELWAGSDALCFTPDGRVLSRRYLHPFISAALGYGAGNAVYEVEQHGLSYAGNQTLPDGNPIPGYHYRLIVPYNGLARWESK